MSDFDIQAITKSMAEQARLLCEQLAEISRLRTALATARNDALAEAKAVCDRHEAYYRARDKTAKMDVAADLSQSIEALITKPTIEGE